MRKDPPAGAEYWVQVCDTGPGESSGEEREAIPFHWDKDEAALAERGAWEHPKLATVLYLTHNAAPTVIFKTHNDQVGNSAAGPAQAAVSYPRPGKHLCFRGNLLHGCPAELSVPSQLPAVPTERITLLVNLWVKRPSGVAAFPEGSRGLLSGPELEDGEASGGRVSLLRESGEYEAEDDWNEPPVHVILAEGDQGTGLGTGWQFLGEHESGFTRELPATELQAMAKTPRAPSTCLVLYADGVKASP